MSTEPTARGGNYEYVIARVRSRRAALFDDDDYRKLVRMGPGEIARFMEDTEYETEMNSLGARHTGVDLIDAGVARSEGVHLGLVLGVLHESGDLARTHADQLPVVVVVEKRGTA